MRRLPLAAALLLAGCGQGGPPAETVRKAKVAHPVVARREADEEAAYSLDSAVSAIADARTEARTLAPKAGGGAGDALLRVGKRIDDAGAKLAEHSDAPPSLEAYRMAPGERDAERRRSLDDALKALRSLRNAQDTLDDLAANVPPEHKGALDAIGQKVDDAIESVEEAVVRLGGKVPPEADE